MGAVNNIGIDKCVESKTSNAMCFGVEFFVKYLFLICWEVKFDGRSIFLKKMSTKMGTVGEIGIDKECVESKASNVMCSGLGFF